jgi:ankyrin repeat protein
MLLAHGAKPNGTNALLRAMDFDDVVAVKMLLDAGADPNGEKDASGNGGVSALHQAARRQVSDEMAQVLLAAGADPGRVYQGASGYGFAKVFGHAGLAAMIEELGPVPKLSKEEDLLALAAVGQVPAGVYLDEAHLPKAYENIIREMVHLPGKLPHIKALVDMGLFYDKPDTQKITPVQIAGWEGLTDVMGYFLTLRPDLSHVNAYGGTLLSTIIHGSENAPKAANKDHVGCARMALEHGVALPKQALRLAGEPAMAAFLNDWAAAHPGQVTGA